MSFVPLYEQIKERIRKDILSTVRRKGTYRLPTERELEITYKVSRPTISKALTALAAEGLLVKEQGRGTFALIPAGKSAEALVPGDQEPHGSTNRIGTARRNIALWITLRPGVLQGNSFADADWNSLAVINGVQNALDRQAFRLIVSGPSGESLEAEADAEAAELTRMAQEADIAGLILWYSGVSANLPVLEKLRAAEIPIVFIDRKPPPEFDADFVGINAKRAAHDMVKTLLAQGHRRIAHVTNPEDVSFVRETLAGYRWALEEAHVPFLPDLVLTGGILGLNVGESTEALAERLLALPDPPTAVFAVTDFLALQLIEALRSRGVSVPEDIAVAGTEDLEQYLFRKPFLTTIHRPFGRMGEEAIRLLVERIEDGPTNVHRNVMLEAPLILRDSTATGRKG